VPISATTPASSGEISAGMMTLVNTAPKCTAPVPASLITWKSRKTNCRRQQLSRIDWRPATVWLVTRNPVGTAARLAASLRAWPMLVFEITEDATSATDGERLAYVPGRGFQRIKTRKS